MNTVDKILDCAIGQEQQAADFYASLAVRVEKAGMKEMLLEFAEEANTTRNVCLQ
jgi:rubrerythrin